MATRTIAQGFEKFHSNITPSSYKTGKGTSHKSSIEAKLKDDFDLFRTFYSGSAIPDWFFNKFKSKDHETLSVYTQNLINRFNSKG